MRTLPTPAVRPVPGLRLLSGALIVALPLAGAAQAVPRPAAPGAHGAIPFAATHWRTDDSTARHETDDAGRETLRLAAGTALARDLTLTDGAVEVEVRPTGRRAFAGIAFRGDDPDELELVYLRFHKSGQPDAVQYTPRFRGNDAWQLYSGTGFTAAATLDTTRWTTLRVEYAGRAARVLVDGQEVLRVPHLIRPPRAGAVGVWALGEARFTAFRATPAPSVVAAASDVRPARAGAISEWELSAVREVPRDLPLTGLVTLLPRDRAGWERVATEPTGLLNVSRVRAKTRTEVDQTRSSTDVVWARALVRSPSAERRALAIGYSDRVVLLVNGEPVFAGDARFRSRGALFLGNVTDEHDLVYVPLRAGMNEILLGVQDQTGGWGFVVRLLDDPASRRAARPVAPAAGAGEDRDAPGPG